MTKTEVMQQIGPKMGQNATAIYAMLSGQIVTWVIIRQRCGLSDHEIAIGWNYLKGQRLAIGDITCGQEGIIFEEPYY